jgi:serine phosphatase RsbU (regulator of sigma subunit)
MKKTLILLSVVTFLSATIAYAEEPVSLSSFLNKQVSKVAEKENEINAKLEAKRKADEAKRAEFEKKQQEQIEAVNSRLQILKDQQEAQKKEAEARKIEAQKQQEASKKAIENEVNYWKGLFNQK